jgi:hypothetical protein
MLKLRLFFLAAGCCLGQWETQTWIRSDAAQFSPAQMRIFLNSICPGHERASGCEVCPAGMASSAAGWDVRAILTGHFLSPSSEDTLVSGFGCEPHANGFASAPCRHCRAAEMSPPFVRRSGGHASAICFL